MYNMEPPPSELLAALPEVAPPVNAPLSGRDGGVSPTGGWPPVGPPDWGR